MVFFVSDGEGGEGGLAAGTQQANAGAIERLHRLDQTGGDLLAGGDEGDPRGIGPDVFPADLPDAVVQEGQAAGGHGGLFQGHAARLLTLLCGVEGVENVHLTAPAADVAVGSTELPMLGTVTISELTEA